MAVTATTEASFDWRCTSTWRGSAYNTMWCLIGCSIGDLGAILWFQTYSPETNVLLVMGVAMVSGIVTSILLETLILLKQLGLHRAFTTAIGMSLASMIAMETAMNLTDYLLVGGARLTWWVLPLMLLVGFLTPWPYNYRRLKKFDKACH